MAVAPKGIDVRAALGGRIVFRASLKDAAGAKLITGTTNLSLYELQDDGTLKTYDFADNTFKATAITTEQQAMTVRKGNNNTTDLGLWSFALTTVTGFTTGAVCFAVVSNTGASPVAQEREFQFGGAEGDLGVSGTNINANLELWRTVQPLNLVAQRVDVRIGAVVAGIITAAAFAADFYTGIAAAVWGAATATYNAATTFGKFFQDMLNATVGSRAVAGDAMTLTPGERTATANEVESQIIDETDSEKVLTAITNKIAAANPSLAGLTLAAIAAQVRTELAVELARIDVVLSSRLAAAGYTAPPSLASILAGIETDHGAGLYTRNTEPDNATINDIAVVTDRLNSMILEDVSNPGFWQYTVDALENGPGGGGATQPIGTGADLCTMNINVGGINIPDADVWITSDPNGATPVAGTLQTDSNGNVQFMLDDGNTYYLWMQKDGVNSILGQQFIADAD